MRGGSHERGERVPFSYISASSPVEKTFEESAPAEGRTQARLQEIHRREEGVAAVAAGVAAPPTQPLSPPSLRPPPLPLSPFSPLPPSLPSPTPLGDCTTSTMWSTSLLSLSLLSLSCLSLPLSWSLMWPPELWFMCRVPFVASTTVAVRRISHAPGVVVAPNSC